jgi:predicted lactoylglutathione lyase
LKEYLVQKMIFANLPVSDLRASMAFYEALGFKNNPQFSDETAACMVWSETIHVMYNRNLADLDGHVWETFWMDASAIPN